MALRREKVTERLLELRERHGLSQEHAAQKVGITHRQWQRWEQGESMPYPRNLDAIASAFGISVAEFFDPVQPAVGTADFGDQLDRIEEMLTEVLALLRPGPAEVLEQEADRVDAQKKRTAASPRRSRQKASGT